LGKKLTNAAAAKAAEIGSRSCKVTTGLQDEHVLVQQCRNGSRDAFEPIVKRYMKDSYYIALGLVGSHDDALEISQEAFYHAYRNIKQLESTRKFFPWFYQILRNQCFTHLRKRKRRREQSLEDIQDAVPTPAPRESYSPQAIAESTEAKQRVWKAIGKLGEKHREVIILRHFRNMSYDQIAKNLYCSKGTVMSRLYNARKKLKDIIASQEGGQNYDL
jgi:RNA polymerase sigma-70 factor (ECF subfamily)